MREYVVDIVCPCITPLKRVRPGVNFIKELCTCSFDVQTIHDVLLCGSYSDIIQILAQRNKNSIDLDCHSECNDLLCLFLNSFIDYSNGTVCC